MIYLIAVAKEYRHPGHPSIPVFVPTNVAIPTDRRVAILGGRLAGKSVLLRLLVGLEPPDMGEVMTQATLSPIINTAGLLNGRVTTSENVRMFARIHGLRADSLAAGVAAFCGGSDFFEHALKTQDTGKRQLLQAALSALLPYDCYLADNAASITPSILERYFGLAEERGAGAIFATVLVRQVWQYAEFVVVIRDQTVFPFANVDEGIAFYEQHAA
jgi:capsular polysaccharide transport system ATP-binding protein